MTEVIIKMGVIDGVYVDMSMGLRGRFSEGVVSLDIGDMSRIEVFQLITGFRDG